MILKVIPLVAESITLTNRVSNDQSLGEEPIKSNIYVVCEIQLGK